MAPFPIIESQPQVPVEPRRASPDQITLSVTHASTTYTTTIPLGAATAATSDAAASTLITTTIASAPTQTAQVTLPRDSSSGSSNTGVVIGAVLGSLLGTLVLLTVLYKCCFDNRSAAWIPTFTSYNSDSDSDSERSSRSSRRVHRRGGGGDGFGRDNRRGDRVRQPRRARTRRSRREESGSRSSRSYSTRYDRRRNSGMSKNNGLLGWFLVPKTTPYGYQYTERKHTRSSWGGGGARGNADD